MLVDFISAGGSEVLVVRKPDENDVLIPFLKSIVPYVDIGTDTIEVVLPEGYSSSTESSHEIFDSFIFSSRCAKRLIVRLSLGSSLILELTDTRLCDQ